MTTITGWALDVSNWSGKITPEWAARRKAEGWNHIIVGTQDAEIARDQLDDALASGMTADAYVFMYATGHGSAAHQIDEALANIGGRQIGRLWIDMEGNHDSPGSEFKNRWDTIGYPAGVLAFIHQASAACAGRVWSGIYTSRSWWMRYTGNSELYKDYPLWLATADGTPDLAYPSFGGWQSCAIEQYQFDVLTDGVNCDWNVMGAPLLPPEPAPPAIDIEGARADLRAALAKLGG